MLTRISVVSGLLVAIVQGAILFGWDITQDQQAWLSGFIVLIGGAIHAWFNPNLPGGPSE
jgi:cytochrome bd-type quinol oxidase subunit 1